MLDLIKENAISIVLILLAVIGIIVACIISSVNKKRDTKEELEKQNENKQNQIECVEQNTEIQNNKNTELENDLSANEDEELQNSNEEQTNEINDQVEENQDITEEQSKNDLEQDVAVTEEETTGEATQEQNVELLVTEEQISESATQEEQIVEESIIEEEQSVEKEKKLETEDEIETFKGEEDMVQEFTEEMMTENVEEINEQNVEEGTVVQEKTKYIGKWVIYQKAEREFIAILKASNGQIVLTSESYASVKSIEAGIETIKKNVAANNFIVYTDKKGKYFYKLKDSGNKLLCIGEVYPTKISCIKSIESVKKFAEKAVIQPEVVEDLTMIYYKPVETEVLEDETQIKDQYRGKWVITKDGDYYSATLYASNGQILLNSEKYRLLDSVNHAIENYKKNSKENNFIIDKDKTGKFYYKLRNSQKLTLAVGETYNTQKDCEKAIESFKRFNRIAKIIPYEAPQPVVNEEEAVKETKTETTTQE